MRKFLACFTLVCVLLSAVAFTVSAQEFTDMPDNWATAALERAVKDGLINGYEGKIMPDDSLTRAQMAAIFVRAFGAEEQADISAFEDMDADAWYYADMAKAVHAGWFKGDGVNLNPDASITREEAFTVIARAFYLQNGDAQMLGAYTDASAVSDWAVPYVTALLKKGLVAGSNGNVNPKNNISRAEFAVVMDRAVAAYVTTEGEQSLDLKGHTGAVIIKANNVVLKDTVIEGDLIYSAIVDSDTINITKTVEIHGAVIKNSSYADDESAKPDGIQTGVDVGGNQGGSQGGNQGGSQGGKPGGSQGGKPGGSQGGSQGGNQGGNQGDDDNDDNNNDDNNNDNNDNDDNNNDDNNNDDNNNDNNDNNNDDNNEGSNDDPYLNLGGPEIEDGGLVSDENDR